MTKITGKQLLILQTLYSRRAAIARENDADERQARLAWATQVLGREVASFRDLGTEEAAKLIDECKTALGQPISPKPAKRSYGKRTPSAKGVVQIATADDLRQVHFWRERFGLSLEQFDSWLASPHSPTRGRKLLTVANCRSVTIALRAMIRRRATTLKRAG
jgi:hypothetical protein